MKQIEAVIDQFRVEEVRSALEDMGVEDIMESTIRCHQKGRPMMFRGATFVSTIVEKVKLDIVAADEAVVDIIEVIGAIARIGRKEDCRLAVHPYLEMN